MIHAKSDYVKQLYDCMPFNFANDKPNKLMLLLFTQKHVCRNTSPYLSTSVFWFVSLQLQTADLGGQCTTSEVVHSIMQEIQKGGPRTSEQIWTEVGISAGSRDHTNNANTW